jgi:hypothetical protein
LYQPLIEPSTKHLTTSGLVVDRGLHRLDRGRVGVKAVIGDKEQVRLETAFALDREGLGGDVALLRRSSGWR